MNKLSLRIAASFTILNALTIFPFFASPAFALDLNSFPAELKLPPLAYSATVAGAAYAHARDMS